MSKIRHSPERDLLVRSYAVTHPPDLHIPDRAFEDWGQLAYAARGVMEVRTPAGAWIVPPHRAVWIPAGTRHAVHMSGTVVVRTLYFRRGLGPVPAAPTAVNVSPLLRELVLHTTVRGLLYRGNASDTSLVRVLLDQLDRVTTLPLQLPTPRDPRARKAADHILAAVGEPNVIAGAAKHAGASKRTLERIFIAETAMTLGRWRQRARLIEALRGLARGHDVTRVALDVGYNSPSAFIAAFRTQLGTTPARYFAPGR